ncbi:GlxA family transcriptional regulator [Siphonobacter aquaeclarae]|jgi:transcriptional regulator GlxA family with amidase domain|uniref:Transcriptional regulator, AraC family with amidase-like domain n=1 Tax=Siphonobacter aquaeclarae TaxID=563176 RepID=A0A1G9IA88_9BACT|nr:helix-turn-helix domain-containing protein [Siphonobacter aquaeclarae]MBO9638633.1 helix-turn-helix domain-containing protein [Siphonobacter aquaeclarae]SDL22026.1 transcriptional regulator, AraC family with amidase-like domain [Siphonobacter aquaeclarae]
MKRITILVPEGAILGSIEGPRQLFTQVNQFCLANGQKPLFQVKLVGMTKDTRISGGLYTIHTDQVLEDVDSTDLVVIPAVDGDMNRALEVNRPFIPWIAQQYEAGAEVASLCLGAFLLASTGLLNGRKCATHWMAARDFRRMFPEVQLIADKVITDESRLYSSGGAYSYLNLILYLIEKYAGRDMAILCSKVFAIEIERESQSPFIIFQGQKEHEDDAIRKAQDFIEAHFQDRLTVDQLADQFSLGRRSFERRFKKATNNTVSEYIQRVKVEAAKKGFEISRKNIHEVMYDVGYTDIKAFRAIFKKTTGLSPVEYRNKYQKMA